MITPLLMKIRKLFYSLLWVVILWITNYASAFDLTSDQIDLLDQMALSSWSVNNEAYPILYEIPNPVNNDFKSLCVVFSGFARSSDFGWIPVFQDTIWSRSNTPYYWMPTPYSLICATWRRKTFYLATNWNSYKFTINHYWVVDSADLMSSFGSTSSTPDCSQDSNYLQCLENLNVANWNVATLSWSLSSCQSDLSSCQNGVDVGYQACLENLSWCNADKTNLTNYNDSLSQQLNECLAELPIPCEWTGCEETIITDQRFSFFRENDWERFSLPVANNVFLPQWLRAYVDSGVVAIARIQEKSDPVLAEWSFSEVNSLFFHFFKTVLVVLFFALFLRFIKALIYPLFIPKNKE